MFRQIFLLVVLTTIVSGLSVVDPNYNKNNIEPLDRFGDFFEENVVVISPKSSRTRRQATQSIPVNHKPEVQSIKTTENPTNSQPGVPNQLSSNNQQTTAPAQPASQSPVQATPQNPIQKPTEATLPNPSTNSPIPSLLPTQPQNSEQKQTQLNPSTSSPLPSPSTNQPQNPEINQASTPAQKLASQSPTPQDSLVNSQQNKPRPQARPQSPPSNPPTTTGPKITPQNPQSNKPATTTNQQTNSNNQQNVQSNLNPVTDSNSDDIDSNGCTLPSINPKQKCCAQSYAMESENAELKKLKRECMDEQQSSNRKSAKTCESDGKPKKGDNACFMACILKKKEVLNGNGDINRAKAKEFVKNELAKTDWAKKSTERVVNKCASSVNRERKRPKGNRGRQNECDKKGMKFLECLSKEFDQECPSANQKAGKKCSRDRNSREKDDDDDNN